MKNPLNKRLLRELKSEFGKYAVIFLLLTGTIGFVSGFLVADGSMIIAYDESFEKYHIEDGNFCTQKELNRAGRKMTEELGITLYDNYYVEEELTNGSTMRIFKNRGEVNLACLMEGEFPDAKGEIAIDRMYAENNHLSVGDTLTNGTDSWTITGLVALPDYSCLFSDNNDSMFDAVKFGVSVVNEEEFESMGKNKITYSYSWKYHQPPKDEYEENDMAEELMEKLAKEVTLTDFVPCYKNQAIQFTGEDMGSDKAMMEVLLYIIIVIMAFVFGVTISNTIVKEANVIGTLRASGYTRSELICHYMMTPLAVTLLGALCGNLLGYTVFKDVCAGMYYGSYSLPTFETVWNAEAFIKTTIVPMILMFCINYLILWQKLKLSPLKFLRRDLSSKKQRQALPLNMHIPFFMRFRIRVILQNISNYVVLFIGFLFANLLLMFGLILPSILNHYQEEIENNLLSKYQYMLQIPMDSLNSDSKLESFIRMMIFYAGVETDNEDAEKFSAYSLQTMDQKIPSEAITFYGLEEDSRYVKLDLNTDGVFISSGYAQKYELKPGDIITLKEKYENKEYSFMVDGIYDYEGTLSVFMEREKLNETFGLDENYFAGYFSETEITDIDKEYIASVIDLDDLTKISRQLNVSMGSMMNLVNAFAIGMYMILIYLLSKIIIEKNAQSISMTKILGYTNGEISRLYIVSTTMVVIVCLLISLPVEEQIMHALFKEMIVMMITGWIPYYVDPVIFVKIFVAGLVTYVVVAMLEYGKIRKVPMDAALKNVE
ncbi:MAG: ABC transporter permease [Thermoflexaceae bacterium]|nr:ABC transporter permease [Thermoflexaceae bacterium]